MHSGQLRVVGSTGSLRERATSAFTGLTTRKKRTMAISTKAISAFRNAP